MSQICPHFKKISQIVQILPTFLADFFFFRFAHIFSRFLRFAHIFSRFANIFSRFLRCAHLWWTLAKLQVIGVSEPLGTVGASQKQWACDRASLWLHFLGQLQLYSTYPALWLNQIMWQLMISLMCFKLSWHGVCYVKFKLVEWNMICCWVEILQFYTLYCLFVCTFPFQSYCYVAHIQHKHKH